jgi:hypothetical protein
VMISSLARREATPASARNFCNRTTAAESRLAFGFAQAGDTVARFPLAPLLQNRNPFKPFHDIAFGP